MSRDDETTRTPDELARRLDAVTAPPALRTAVQEAVAQDAFGTERTRAGRAGPSRPRLRVPLVPAIASAVTVAAVLFVLLVAVGGGGGDGRLSPLPTVADAAPVALRSATAPAPSARPGGELLAFRAGPIAFPTWRQAGLRVVGARTDVIDGRELRTVFYADGRGRRIGYAIADGALPSLDGRTLVRRGVRMRVFRADAAAVVTWERDGRTCILAARGVPAARLVALASYSA